MTQRDSCCAALLVCLLAPQSVVADDVTRRATRLEPLVLNAADGFSIKRYELEAGVYYRWRIQSDGLEEYKLLAPDFFRESWIDQVVVEGLEVKPMGLHAIEFDKAGEMDVWFVTIRPGTYPFYIEGLKRQGFNGELVVK